jgi:hypothetical protein
MNDDSYTAQGSGWQWTPLPWLIREWACFVGSYGLDAARQLARTADERAALDAAIEGRDEKR